MPAVREDPMPEVPDAQELIRWFEEHGELDRLTEVAQNELSSGRIGRATRAMAELGEALEAHFAAEEEVYFPLIKQIVGGYSSVVVAAELGHKKIRERFELLTELLADGDLAAARQGFDLLLARLRRHEADEARIARELRRPS